MTEKLFTGTLNTNQNKTKNKIIETIDGISQKYANIMNKSNQNPKREITYVTNIQNFF